MERENLSEHSTSERVGTRDSVINRLLRLRGFEESRHHEFFSDSLRELADLSSLKDLDRASEAIADGLEKGEAIGIYGDYDVDGTTSCALLWRFFQMLGTTPLLFQPSRFIEGYGLHESLIDKAASKNVTLLITVDCGISNAAAADHAKKKGVKLIITDHHQDAAEKMPEAFAVVNPNRRDEECPTDLKSLAGVGVAFAVALSTKNLLEKKGKRLPSLYPLLQYVAIGTIADLARLVPTNLKLVRHGLRQIPKTCYPGLAQFLSADDKIVPQLDSDKISFGIAPLINSKGRLDHPELALQLIISDDPKESYEMHHQLKQANTDRKKIQRDVFDEARSLVLKEIEENKQMPCCLVYRPNWHEGVIGIVASKLVETFRRPAIVFTNAEEEGVIKASARSVDGLDLFAVLQSCEEFFLKFGGHKAAAGLSMQKEKLREFRKSFFYKLGLLPQSVRTSSQASEMEIPFSLVDAHLLQDLKRLSPFGIGNPRPVFRSTKVKLKRYEILKDKHVKWYFERFCRESNEATIIPGISFFYFERWQSIHPMHLSEQEALVDMEFTLQSNVFRGNESLQLFVGEIGPSGAVQ